MPRFKVVEKELFQNICRVETKMCLVGENAIFTQMFEINAIPEGSIRYTDHMAGWTEGALQGTFSNVQVYYSVCLFLPASING